MDSKTLITGSMGFIGSHLMKSLGDRGIEFDIKKSPYFDVNKPANLQAVILKNKPQYIVHLAAISTIQEATKDPELTLKTNIIGTFNVLRLAKKYNIRVILASSAATAQPELSLYGTSKDCMEKIAEMFDNVCVLRFHNVYGKGGKGVVNKFIRRIKQGKEVKLNGNTTRDYIYIDDVVKVILRTLDMDCPSVVCPIGTGKGISLKELVRKIEKNTKKAQVKYGEAIREIQKSESNMGVVDAISLNEGIRRLI